MQLEIYDLRSKNASISVDLVAICDSFSSLLWDVEYYQCGAFEVYIAATPANVEAFQLGRVVGRDDDDEHFGLIESVQIETNAEDGDYLTVSGRFLTCLLERRIIYPTFSGSGTYQHHVRNVLARNAINCGLRSIPGLTMGVVTGSCWTKTTRLQVSYENLMEWVYTICEMIGGTINIRIEKSLLKCDLSQGTDRSILQTANPQILFSDTYNNLLQFSYAADASVQKNFAYVFGSGEGSDRKRTTYFSGDEPSYLDRYEVYVDQRDTAHDDSMTDSEYLEILKASGEKSLISPKIASESAIAAIPAQFQYGKDYFVGDYVSVTHSRFGLRQNKIQLIGMIESFDENGRSLTPTFQEV